MTKKTKPVKLAPGKYSFRGYIIKSHGSYSSKENMVWKAVNEETETVEYTGGSLHEVANLINQKIG